LGNIEDIIFDMSLSRMWFYEIRYTISAYRTYRIWG
jgi:hypothetical protein